MIIVICVLVTVFGLGILGGALIQWAISPRPKPSPTDEVTGVCDRCGKEIKQTDPYAQCEMTIHEDTMIRQITSKDIALCQKCSQEVFFEDYAKILTKIAASKDFGDATKLDENGTLNTLSQETSR